MPIVKKMMNVLAERVYLITNDFQISDDIKEIIWVSIKSLIFRGEAFKNEDVLITNLHLDLVLLSCIYHFLKHDLD